MKPQTLTLQGRLAEIRRVSQFVADFCRSEELDTSEERVMMLILEELVTNTVKHGSPPADASIEVEVARQGEEVHVTYRDRGMPFDPTEAPEPDLSATLTRRRAGGLGLPLIRHYTTSMDYSREGECNVLKLVVPVGIGRLVPPAL